MWSSFSSFHSLYELAMSKLSLSDGLKGGVSVWFCNCSQGKSFIQGCSYTSIGPLDPNLLIGLRYIRQLMKSIDSGLQSLGTSFGEI
jgi:hypothetical protein